MKSLTLLKLIVPIASELTDDIVIQFDILNTTVVREFEEQYGLEYVGQLFDDHAHFKQAHRMRRSAEGFLELDRHHNVKWFEQQVAKKRTKRDNVEAHEIEPYQGNDPMWGDYWYINTNYKNDEGKTRDQMFDDQYIHHMNVEAVWAMGYSGKGVVVSIIDDGIEHSHPDLHDNYDPKASTDINGHDDDPFPHYNGKNKNIDFDDAASYLNNNMNPPLTENLAHYLKEINRHGTRCSGQVAAKRDNGVCVPGIAFNSRIGGVRMLDGSVTDQVEASSLSLNPQHIDIYSSSWGPDDDGATLDGPAKLARKAFRNGAEKGRDGKGSIFIWASGNGGRSQDNCNCDGYTNSIYTITISSTSELENIPWYSEYCVSTLASTYSSGTYSEKKTLSTDLHGICTEAHTGTSASAPIAAGIIALLLEANPALGWRDVQHLIVQTSNKNNLNAPDWKKNAMGRWFSGRYGYGLMDAEALVRRGISWSNVPEQRHFGFPIIRTMKAQDGVRMKRASKGDSAFAIATFTITADDMRSNEHGFINLIEHATIKITNKSNNDIRRGNLRMVLQSPLGTKTTILDTRRSDYSRKRLEEDHFMSVELWDEKALGEWKFTIENTDKNQGGYPRIFELDLHLTGTGNDQYEL